jgi:hypothetical protein
MKRATLLSLTVPAVLTLTLTPSESAPDILFKGKDPIKIGRGSQKGNLIEWTDCDGKNKTTYDAPPHSVDAADNCTVSPGSFGLSCEGQRCTIIDEPTFRRYVDAGRKGDQVELQIGKDSVEIRHHGRMVRLQR